MLTIKPESTFQIILRMILLLFGGWFLFKTMIAIIFGFPVYITHLILVAFVVYIVVKLDTKGFNFKN